MPNSSPSERQLVARLAAHESWAHTPNRTARTAPARDAFLAKFEDLVDPNHELPADERARRATSARKAHFSRLALKSAQARRATAARRQALEELREATALLAAVSEPPDGPGDGEGEPVAGARDGQDGSHAGTRSEGAVR